MPIPCWTSVNSQVRRGRARRPSTTTTRRASRLPAEVDVPTGCRESEADHTVQVSLENMTSARVVRL